MSFITVLLEFGARAPGAQINGEKSKKMVPDFFFLHLAFVYFLGDDFITAAPIVLYYSSFRVRILWARDPESTERTPEEKVPDFFLHLALVYFLGTDYIADFRPPTKYFSCC